MLNVDQNRIKDALVTKTSNAVMQRIEKAQYKKQLSDYNTDIAEEKSLLQSLPRDIQFVITNSAVQDLIGQRNIFAVIILITSLNDVIKGLFESYRSRDNNDAVNSDKETVQYNGTNVPVPPVAPPIQHNGTNVPYNVPFTYETGSRILSAVVFFDPFKQFDAPAAAAAWLTDFGVTVAPALVNVANNSGGGFGTAQIMLQSPNIWAGQATNSFNSIVTDWDPVTGRGGTLLPLSMNLTGKGIDVPAVDIAGIVLSTPRWDIVGSNAVTDTGAPADLRNLAIVPRSRYSEFTFTKTNETETETMLRRDYTIDDMYKATGGYPASIHIHNGKIFALIVMEDTGVGVMLHPSYILNGDVFVDKHNATIRKLTYEGYTYDIIKVDVNHWRLEPDNIEFTELAAITLQNEVPSLGNPVVWRKDHVTGIWREVYAQFNDSGEVVIANTSANHFSDWAINQSDIVFRVNGVDIIESDGVRSYGPSSPLFYSVTVNDPTTAVVDVFEKPLNTDDYIATYGELYDDEDDLGSKVMSVSYEFNNAKYDRYRSNAEIPLNNKLKAVRWPAAFVANVDDAFYKATDGAFSEFGDRVVYYSLTLNTFSYLQFLQYLVEQNIDAKAMKYISGNIIAGFHTDTIQGYIDGAADEATISLNGTKGIIANTNGILDRIVATTAGAQPTEPTQEWKDEYRAKELRYRNMLLPIQQVIYDNSITIKTKFDAAMNASYAQSGLNISYIAPYFKQNLPILEEMIAALKDTILKIAGFVDIYIDQYTLAFTKSMWNNKLLPVTGYTTIADATDAFFRSDKLQDIASDTFDLCNAAAIESALLDTNPFFSNERSTEEYRLERAAWAMGRRLSIKIAEKPAILLEAEADLNGALVAHRSARAESVLAEEAARHAAGIAGQLNFNPGNGAGDINYAAARAAMYASAEAVTIAVELERTALDRLAVVWDAYRHAATIDVGVDATTLATIAGLATTARTSWESLNEDAEITDQAYNDAVAISKVAADVQPTSAETVRIDAAKGVEAAAKASWDAACLTWYAAAEAVNTTYDVFMRSRTDNDEATYRDAMQTENSLRYDREVAYAVYATASAATQTATHSTTGYLAWQITEVAVRDTKRICDEAADKASIAKTLYTAAAVRLQRATVLRAN